MEEATDRAGPDVTRWLSVLSAFEAQCGKSPPRGTQAAVARIRMVLQALARGECALPAGLPEASWPPPEGSATLTANELHRRRAAMLQLGVWHAVTALPAQGADPLAQLPAQLARTALTLPPGLAPTSDYARGTEARLFFAAQPRSALVALAREYDKGDPAGPFATLLQACAYDDSLVTLHAMSCRWTIAAAAVYADMLLHRRGQSDQADEWSRRLWPGSTPAVRIRLRPGRVVLPRRETALHFDLWTTYVPAQVLAHDSGRHDAPDQHWQRLRFEMHDIGDLRRSGDTRTGVRVIRRCLGIEMLYQAVFVDRVAMTRETHAGPAALPGLPVPMVVDIPGPPPGHQAGFELLLRWRDESSPPLFGGSVRRRQATPADESNAKDEALRDAYRASRRPARAHVLDAARLGWQPAAPGERCYDEDGIALLELGHAALWDAAGDDCQWLDVALLVWAAGRWQSWPLCLVDDEIDDAERCRLLLDLDAPPNIDASAVQAAFGRPDDVCWSIRPAGTGAFLTIGADLERR